MEESNTSDALRDEVRGWLAEHWDQDASLTDWRGLLADSGWGCPTWPAQWCGKGLGRAEAAIVSEEFQKVGAVGPATGVGMVLAAATILEHGSDDIKSRFLRPIVTGEHTWCQLFSEPGSGSDLAGLTTRAERDGDEWVVNGQKVWTSGAHRAAWGMLLARTNWDAPKHRGITFFAFPIQQPGIEVRPLRQMNGHASFNEVFMTDARVNNENVVGEVDGGWAVALTTLAHERGLASALGAAMRNMLGSGRAAGEALTEAAEYMKTYQWYPQRAGRADLVTSQAVSTGRAKDPMVRQHIAIVETQQRVTRWNAERSQAARAKGRPPGPEGSLAKLSASNIARAAAAAHSEIAGAHAMLTGADSPLGGVIAEVLVSVPAVSIAGGTDAIQHNIIGERVLALPREPQTDTEVAFRDLRTNTLRD